MKVLMTYFSWSNNTKKLVEAIDRDLHLDVIRIEREIPYSSDYSYDEILLFVPIWWYTIPMPVATFVEENLKGYQGKVILFANSYTNDPQYMVNSLRDLKDVNPDLNIQEGLFNKSVNAHISFINKEVNR